MMLAFSAECYYPQSLSKLRIVVIEDDPSTVAILRYALESLGEPSELIVLRDGEEAIRFVQDQCRLTAPEPCVIVLDIHLPKYDGLEVLREIVSHPPLSHVQVVTTSSRITPSTLTEVTSLGAIHAEKPNSLDGYRKFAQEIVEVCKKTLLIQVA